MPDSKIQSSKVPENDNGYILAFEKFINEYSQDITNKNIKFLIKEIFERYRYHYEEAMILKEKYNNRNILFSWFIPVYSALLTFLLSLNKLPSFDFINLWFSEECSILEKTWKTFSHLLPNLISILQGNLALLGFIFTIVTIFISIWKPYERYISSSQILISMTDWRIDFICGLNQFRTDNNEENNYEDDFMKYLKEQNKEMTKTGQSILESLIVSND